MSVTINGTSGIDSTGIQEDASGNVGIGTSPFSSSTRLTFRGTDTSSVNTRWEDSAGTLVAQMFNDGTFAIRAPNALGYGTGAGGTVTQITSKSTGVTINKPTGQITMHNAALAAGASITFTVSNSLVSALDTIIAIPNFGSVVYRVQPYAVGAGYFSLSITNLDSISRTDALPINFAIIKGASA